MSSWSPLPVVLCPNHGAPCLLKTGTSDGPSKGRSFFICSFTNGNHRCDFVQKAPRIPSRTCPKHGGMVELQGLKLSSSQQLLSYRCKLRPNSNEWCGKELFTVPRTTTPPDLADSKMQVDQQLAPDSHRSRENVPLPMQVEKHHNTMPFSTKSSESGTVHKGRVSDERKTNVPLLGGSEHEGRPSVVSACEQQAHVLPEVSTLGEGHQFMAVMQQVCEQPRQQAQDKHRLQQPQERTQQQHHLNHHNHQEQSKQCVKAEQFHKEHHLNNPQQQAGQQEHIMKQPQACQQQTWQEQALQPQPVAPKKEHKFTFTRTTHHQPKQDDLSKVQVLLSNISLASKDNAVALAVREDMPSLTSNGPTSVERSVASTITSVSTGSKSNVSSVLLAARLRQQEGILERMGKSLPDGGARLREQCKQLRQDLEVQREREKQEEQDAQGHKQEEKMKLEMSRSGAAPNLTVSGLSQPLAAAPSLPSFSGGAPDPVPLVQPVNLYLNGTHHLDYYKTRSVAREVIDMLHKQLESCPAPTVLAEDPTGLQVDLMEHQRHALAWLRWREQQSPSGGVLADDMGLGKTLTMISLVLKHKQNPVSTLPAEPAKEDTPDIITSRSTLVVCPASLVLQWKAEVERRVGGRQLSVLVHHGSSRSKEPKELVRYDIVITTYGVVQTEAAAHIPDDEDDSSDLRKKAAKQSKRQAAACPLLQVGWLRVILDEAHTIRNPKCSTSKSVCLLHAERRWALTGTPIQNNLIDMYSLLKFLRCHPFNDFKVWKLLVDNSKRGVATARLNSVVKALLLRRMKDQTTACGEKLISLPAREVVTHDVSLSEEERGVYEAIFNVSKSVVAAYVERAIERAEERGNPVAIKPVSAIAVKEMTSSDSNAATRYANQCLLDRVRAHIKERGPGGAVLTLLLRLRQCCCHLGLLTHEAEKMDVDAVDIPLEQQLLGLSLAEDAFASALEDDTVSMPRCFKTSSPSTKIAAVLECLLKVRRDSDGKKPMKSIVVSQWTRMLDIISSHLKKNGFRCSRIDGSMSTQQRQAGVEDFNNNPTGPEVMLLSLAAGGVGLNLIGGNHLFLMDLHWNPALEKQAFDRIYRVGQTRDVTIHKFISQGTIEGRIVQLQEKKLQLADGVLTGGAVSSKKLTLQDLRHLFDI